MEKTVIDKLRAAYHADIFQDVLRVKKDGIVNNADSGSRHSAAVAAALVAEIGIKPIVGTLNVQATGSLFEQATEKFVSACFSNLTHLRPGKWQFSSGGALSSFEQYEHLAGVREELKRNRKLRAAFGDYIVKPDIILSREPVKDADINKKVGIVNGGGNATLTPLRVKNSKTAILHASISCKWTLRSDRSQNARTEGLNLIRSRKGRTPHIVIVTGEPTPMRIATIALGTGDIDCVYHFALPELQAAVKKTSGEDAKDMLATLVEGKRLRDISDLPFDLAI